MINPKFILSIFAIFFGTSIFSQDCVTADYPFNGDSDDNSVNEYDGIPYSPILSEDRFGNPQSAYLFNGTEDYIEVNNNQAVINSVNFTITVWAKINGPGGGSVMNNPIFMQRDDSPEIPTVSSLVGLFADYAGNCTFMVRTNNPLEAVPVLVQFPKVEDNDWHFYAAIKNNNSLLLYIDSNLVASQAFIDTEVFNNSIDYVEIGRHTYSNTPRSYFNGAIDDLKIFNCALNHDEISSIFEYDPLTAIEITAETDLINEIIIYPNPTTGYVFIQNDNNQIIKLDIIDATGTMLKSLEIQNTTKLDLSFLPVGPYFLKSEINGFQKTYKLIKLN